MGAERRRDQNGGMEPPGDKGKTEPAGRLQPVPISGTRKRGFSELHQTASGGKFEPSSTDARRAKRDSGIPRVSLLGEIHRNGKRRAQGLDLDVGRRRSTAEHFVSSFSGFKMSTNFLLATDAKAARKIVTRAARTERGREWIERYGFTVDSLLASHPGTLVTVANWIAHRVGEKS